MCGGIYYGKMKISPKRDDVFDIHLQTYWIDCLLFCSYRKIRGILHKMQYLSFRFRSVFLLKQISCTAKLCFAKIFPKLSFGVQVEPETKGLP